VHSRQLQVHWNSTYAMIIYLYIHSSEWIISLCNVHMIFFLTSLVILVQKKLIYLFCYKPLFELYVELILQVTLIYCIHLALKFQTWNSRAPYFLSVPIFMQNVQNYIISMTNNLNCIKKVKV
jgi:hypothetical protein